MVRVRSVLFIAVIIIGAFAGSNSYAQTACPSFPQVPWWTGLSHESVAALVEDKFGGDWDLYARAWEGQLKKLRRIRANGSAAVVRNKARQGKKVTLRGAKLISYIANVRQRLAVTRCLAGEADNPAALVKAAIAGPAKAHVCMQCHGEQGISVNPMIPNLAGQNKLYLVKQLKEFQAGLPSQDRSFGPAERHSRIMKSQVKSLENKDLWNLASFFSELPACPVNKNKVNGNKQGAGTTKRKPPKSARQCVECHSPQWSGAATVVPQLGGQKRQYLLRQLYAFRLSPDHPNQNKSPGQTKETRYHFLMSGIAKSLKKTELYELAEYYAEQGCS